MSPITQNSTSVNGLFTLSVIVNETSLHYTWPCIRTAVIEYVKSCLMCNKRKAVGGSKAPLHPLPLVEGVWERIAMDIVGPIQESAKAYRYILVISDYASRFVFTVPMRNQTAKQLRRF
ncbi:Uncharacterized protein APZ42_000586 [Daphnia magna]|uniref:Integrase zinc-binding domain-containing protein n=1 Tax=Daphnia magna TaxID=35525 RepID=A0A164JIS5_9CRUS|nr:Uncharacterized protein APZ42_000586 [Daphnia magna]